MKKLILFKEKKEYFVGCQKNHTVYSIKHTYAIMSHVVTIAILCKYYQGCARS